MPDTLIRVLLVEDNAADARLLREALAEAGPGSFRTHCVASLKDAAATLKGDVSYAVILLDLSLPDSDGLDTVWAMHQTAPDLPIVVMTGLADESVGTEAIRCGAQDYLIKGQADRRVLVRTIRYALERKGLEVERDHLIEALRSARDELELRVHERTADLRRTVRMLEEEVRARAQAEEAFRTSETRLRMLLGQIPAIIWATDAELRITSSYGTSPMILALPPENPEVETALRVGPREPIISAHRLALKGESRAVEMQLKDRTYQCRVEPLRTADGAIVGCLGIAVDITEHRELEEQRAGLQAQLHHAYKLDMIGRLAAGLGHDFGNVLATVAGYSSVARSRLPEDHPAIEALDAIDEAARQTRGITNALLSFGRQSQAERRPLNLCAVMEESSRLLRHTLPASVELTTTGCDPPVWVVADPVQVQQVLLNLALNARDAMPDGGRLEIAISRAAEADIRESADGKAPHAGVACLVVRDTGAGMSPEVQSRIFEPFFTTKAHGRGTGLGLSIIHGIIESLGGRIRVASEVGKGTAFTILLPCIEAPLPPEAGEVSPAAARPGGVIVLADANPHIRGVMAAALGSLGYEVAQADDGTAMAACYEEQRDRVRLLVVSHEVLERGGAEWVRGLRQNGRRMPVIVLSEDAEAGVDEALRTDVSVLQRPFLMPELKRLVHEILST
jgi:two-component system cell cycle sensor histidine kinase/response regulator CckA